MIVYDDRNILQHFFDALSKPLVFVISIISFTLFEPEYDCLTRVAYSMQLTFSYFVVLISIRELCRKYTTTERAERWLLLVLFYLCFIFLIVFYKNHFSLTITGVVLVLLTGFDLGRLIDRLVDGELSLEFEDE